MTLEQEVMRLKEENARLIGMVKGKAVGTLTFKVTPLRLPGANGPQDKGAMGGQVAVYGLQKFPTTLGMEQWRKVLGVKEALLSFIQAEDDKGNLAVKDSEGNYYVPSREPVESVVADEEPVTA